MITATVSHEMRAPVFFILSMIENIVMVTSNHEQLKMLKIINNSAQLLLYLVNDMLDIYLLKTGKFQKILEEFNLYEILG
jgi:signal transduction histidine kinase